MATQTEPRPQPDYNCPMAELYAGLIIVWKSQAENELKFIEENTLYTAGLSVGKILAIKAAQQLPDGQARGAEAETLRLKLVEKHDLVLGKWNSLDGYIKKAFKGEFYKPRIEEAGKQYYDKAVNKNWEYVKQLLISGKSFLTEHNAVLLAEGGMPVTFVGGVAGVGGYDQVQAEFEGLYDDFKDAQQDELQQTDVKMKANNAIYKDGREMMEDGKHIFRKDASLRERFVWERVLELLTPTTGDGTVVIEADLNAGANGNIDLSEVDGNEDSTVTIAVTQKMRFSAGPSAGSPPGPLFLDLNSGDAYVNLAESFAAAVGLNGGNPFLNVQNIGGATGHYKVTFKNLNA